MIRDFDFLNETLSFLYAILLEIIRRTRYSIKHRVLNVDKSVSSLVGDKRLKITTRTCTCATLLVSNM